MIRTGVNIGYSDEFRDRETNDTLLKAIAELPAKARRAGQVAAAAAGRARRTSKRREQALRAAAGGDPFRRDLPQAVSTQDIWPWLVLLASCVFFADVFVRRVQVDFQLACSVLGAFRGSRAATRAARCRPRKRCPGCAAGRPRSTARSKASAPPRASSRMPPFPMDPNAMQAAEAKPTRRVQPPCRSCDRPSRPNHSKTPTRRDCSRPRNKSGATAA